MTQTSDSAARSLRIVFMGTPDFAVPSLEALLGSRHEVVAVVTNPDRPAGRGKKLTPSPVKRRALEAGVEVFQPKGFRKSPEPLEQLATYAPDLIVVTAYGRILPQSVLDLPEMGCLNVHASLLPGYRGAAPLNWCIVRGEARSGVTIMEMEAGLDTGPMLLKGGVEIPTDMTAQGLHDALAPLGGALLLEAIDGLLDGSITPEPQDDALASWAPMIKKSDGHIDWTASAHQVHDLVRGFYPWPGTYAQLHAPDAEPARLKFHGTQVDPEARTGAPGEVLSTDGELVIACGQGAVRVLRIQAPGKRVVEVRDFLNGYTLPPGSIFR